MKSSAERGGRAGRTTTARASRAPSKASAPAEPPKRGRGRPRLDASGADMRQVGIRVPEAEAAALEALAVERCTTVSDLLRGAIAELLAGAARARR